MEMVREEYFGSFMFERSVNGWTISIGVSFARQTWPGPLFSPRKMDFDVGAMHLVTQDRLSRCHSSKHYANNSGTGQRL